MNHKQFSSLVSLGPQRVTFPGHMGKGRGSGGRAEKGASRTGPPGTRPVSPYAAVCELGACSGVGREPQAAVRRPGSPRPGRSCQEAHRDFHAAPSSRLVTPPSLLPLFVLDPEAIRTVHRSSSCRTAGIGLGWSAQLHPEEGVQCPGRSVAKSFACSWCTCPPLLAAGAHAGRAILPGPLCWAHAGRAIPPGSLC